MKDKIAHLVAAFIVLGISMMAITYMFYGEIDWIQTIIFAIAMAFADLFIFKKLRERKK